MGLRMTFEMLLCTLVFYQIPSSALEFPPATFMHKPSTVKTNSNVLSKPKRHTTSRSRPRQRHALFVPTAEDVHSPPQLRNRASAQEPVRCMISYPRANIRGRCSGQYPSGNPEEYLRTYYGLRALLECSTHLSSERSLGNISRISHLRFLRVYLHIHCNDTPMQDGK